VPSTLDLRRDAEIVRNRSSRDGMCTNLDPASGDLLHVRSDSPVGPLLDWIATHPGASTACNLIVRTNPSNDQNPSISAIATGVSLLLSSGDAAGRVTAVTLFDPSVVSQQH
jgi:hypothetical protein